MPRINIRKILSDRGFSPEERRAVLEGLFVFGQDKQIPYLIKMGVLLNLSAIIATAGLISDSAAVVIGAMLVAPLMNPVMAAAGAVIMGWPRRFYSSIWMISLMGIGALGISSFITWLSPELVFIPEQVLARTRPTYYDLIIALAAGSAGAYTLTSKESNAIPGVAVAVALLPPLASAGILLTTGESDLAIRAIVLFLTNLVAMILAGALTFIAVGVYPAQARKKSNRFVYSQLFLFLLLTASVCVPLWFYSQKTVFNDDYRAAKSTILQHWLTDNQLTLKDTVILEESRTVIFDFEGPNPPVNIAELHQRLEASAASKSDDKLVQPIKIEYTWTQKITGSWPSHGSTIQEVADKAKVSSDELSSHKWAWKLTQYSDNNSTEPSGLDSFTLAFESKSKFRISAECGSWTGRYAVGSNFISFDMYRNIFSACKNDQNLKLFVNDLKRARTVFIEDNTLRITLASSEGIIYFERK